ncbi:hypothetical protein CBR_g832 [Chara braunii]|uniref:HD-associated domain-containing protein n=1 Tax=Chara braunii TaxID=69332 RepID=A0A388KCA8_CHABU|nr:hypothetical protein CBR_g832 [Chara braunii]|eukprot:GBG67704.1 hypothetical protein CBR_g832 [Chara braunii]
MSTEILDMLIDDNNIDIDPEMIKKAKEMILATSTPGFVNNVSTMTKGFLYDIVANPRTGIDVDKFDYLARDSYFCGVERCFDHERVMNMTRVVENQVCFKWSEAENVYEMFQTRAKLFRRVYAHRKVKGIESMIADALKAADPVFRLKEAIEDPREFMKLDDRILYMIERSEDPELKEAQSILGRLHRREIYQYVNECIVPYEMTLYYQSHEVTEEDVTTCQMKEKHGIELRPHDIVVHNLTINYGAGTSNPTVGATYRKYQITRDLVSLMMPCKFCEIRIRVYCKSTHPRVFAAAGDAFQEFQRKSFGRSQSIHSTSAEKGNKKRHRSRAGTVLGGSCSPVSNSCSWGMSRRYNFLSAKLCDVQKGIDSERSDILQTPSTHEDFSYLSQDI